MNKDLKSKSNSKTGKKLFLFVVLPLLIFQLSIPVILRFNDKILQEKGTVFRIKVKEVNIKYNDDAVTVDFYKVENKDNAMSKMDNLTYDMQERKGFYYNVIKDEYGKAVLVDTNLSRLNKTDYLQVTTGIKNSFGRPRFYIKGDQIKPIVVGTSNGIGYINIDAEVIVYKGAYIIKQIYINQTPYEEFVEDNYFELLDIEGL